jgi:hypothetical protein
MLVLRPADGLARTLYPALYSTRLTWRYSSYLGQNWSQLTWQTLPWSELTWDNIAWNNIAWNNIAWDAYGFD